MSTSTQKVIFITGATSGIGLECANFLTQHGHSVYGGGRQIDPSANFSFNPLHIDVTSNDSITSAVDHILTHEKHLDVVINNAGILRDKTFLKMEPENWQAVLDVHLNGAYHVSRPAFGVMKEKGYGRVLLTTSAAGLYGNFGQTNYTAAKLALVGFMNTLKLEGKKYNVKVNTIAPVAASRLTEDVLPPEGEDPAA